jgi:hypothetical protein
MPSLSRVAAFALLVLPSLVAGQALPDIPSSVSIHGYLTQAYGRTDRHQLAGLTNAGTSDYRRAAIVTRYAASPGDNFVVQVGHRRLGDSPTMQFEDNLKIDMAFYEHRFETGTAVRIGKTLMPFGIYNEIRYAGTLLPFYRAPMSVYWEGTYTNETIDGVLLSHQFHRGGAWELSADLFGGSYGLLEFGTVPTSPTTTTFTGARLQAKDVIGAQLWLSTPIEGLRFGLNGRHHKDVGGLFPRGDGVSSAEWNASIDGSFDTFQLRAEGLRSRTMGVTLRTGYAQLGVRPTQLLSFNAQSEVVEVESGPASGDSLIPMMRDNAIGMNLHLGPMTVLKLEAHATKGVNYEQVTNMQGAPLTAAYFISSFSVSF